MLNQYVYPAELERIPNGSDYVVRFPDFHEAITFGLSRAEALERAVDCLREALRGRMRDGEDIPLPSERSEDAVLVQAPAEIAVKAAVYQAFRERGTTRVALAAQLKVDESEVRRILDPSHRTKLERLEQAAQALGGRLKVTYEPQP